MNCPKCNADMGKVDFHNIEIDRCTNCKGIWFDMLEHEDLKKIKGSGAIDTGDPEKGKEYNKIDLIDCPKCRSRMVRMVDAAQPHIWYESCSLCHGVFFDAGEFTDFKEHTMSEFFKNLKEKNPRI